jgi:hypothetical protein
LGREGKVEETVRWSYQPFAKQRPPDLQHELVIVLKTQLQNALDCPHGTVAIAQLQEGLA